MNNRQSYFTNFSTNSLFAIWEQNVTELSKLELKRLEKNNNLLNERIKQINLVVSTIKSVLMERYLVDDISLDRVVKYFLNSTGIRENFYKDLFVLKILESDGLIDLKLLERAIDKLEMDELMTIIRLKENTVYGVCAVKKYDKMLFDVETDVYDEYVKKIKLDGKEE